VNEQGWVQGQPPDFVWIAAAAANRDAITAMTTGA
jgi:hypothetical protein